MAACNIENINEWIGSLRAGDEILLSGCVYTARDAAHKRLAESIKRGESLPFDLQDAVIYYAGPTPNRDGQIIGSCGPTTSGRMDVFTPMLYDLGLGCTIGKGKRTPEVTASIVRNSRAYLCALGGAGALAAQCVKSLEVIAYEDLGCESIKRLVIEDFPLYVAIDSTGADIYNLSNNG